MLFITFKVIKSKRLLASDNKDSILLSYRVYLNNNYFKSLFIVIVCVIIEILDKIEKHIKYYT